MYEDALLGFRNHWYPAMFSPQVRETEIKTLTLLGEDILFKRVDGTVHAVRDECLHRGFQFSAKPECITKNTITWTIAVRTQAGGVRVFQGMCPHQKRALADGGVEGDVLTCAAHMWEFDLETGEGINAALAGLASYPSRVEGDEVLVDASAVEPVALWS